MRTIHIYAGRWLQRGGSVILSVSACLQMLPAHAALRSWDGGGPDNFWTTAANWTNDVAPATGDDLLFPSGAARQQNNNNFPAGTTFNSIIFSGGSYVLDGNPLALNAGIVATNGLDHWVRNPLTLNSNQTFMLSVGSSGFYLPGAVNLNGKDLTIAVTLLTIAQVQAVISGSGSLIKAGTGSLSLYASNTLSGPLQLNEGTTTLYHAGALGATNGGTEIGATGTLNLLNTIFLAEPLFVSGALRAVGAGTKVLTGPITLTATNATIETSSGNLLTINGRLIGSGGFNKTGSGTLVLNATNTYTGTTTNASGTLLINGFQAQSPIVLTGGFLGGAGTVGTVTKSGALAATVAPGASPGILNASNVIFGSPTTFAVELSGTTPGTGYDQLNVSGTVTLSNAFLTTSLGLDPPVGTAYTIINNDGTDAVLGTFNARPEGSIISVGGKPFQIAYTGGSGNDVVLTRISPPTRLTAISRLGNGQVQLQATGGLSAFSYTIQAATNVNPVVQWSNLGSVVASGAGTVSFTDTNATLFPMRFYRALSP